MVKKEFFNFFFFLFSFSQFVNKIIKTSKKKKAIIYGNSAKILTPSDFGIPEYEERQILQNPSIFISPSPSEMDYAADPYQGRMHQPQLFPVYGVNHIL